MGNRSSGKMGYSIAQAAAERGAEVTLVTGPSALTPPPNIKVVNVETTQQMMDACLAVYDGCDIVIKRRLLPITARMMWQLRKLKRKPMML